MTKIAAPLSFAPAREADWLDKAIKALKGADPARLNSTTHDGFTLKPVYGPGTAPAVAARPGGQAWTVTQRVDHPQAADANRLALADLEGGADGLTLVLAGAGTGRGFGLEAAALARALEGVELHMITLRLETGPQHERALTSLEKIISAQAQNPARLKIRFGRDPLGDAIAGHGLASDWAAKLADDVRRLGAADFTGPFAEADGRAFHEAGASDAQELGLTLAAAVAYLRALDGAPEAIGVTLAAGADMFSTLAKFRAMRLLWAQVLATSGLPPTALALHGETSWRAMSLCDHHVNMLRAVAGVFGAGLGGADSISVLPMTLPFGLPDEFARRMARNAQIVLLEESQLHRVADPLAGSGYGEALTAELAAAAWAVFQESERMGGLAAGLATGKVAAMIAAAEARQRARIASRAQPLTGTSEFPKISETAPAVLMPRPGPEAAGAPRLLPSLRLSEPFEALRAQAATAEVPAFVQLVILGSQQDATVRQMWVSNLLAAGGIATSEAPQSVVILCGSDAAYAEHGINAVRAAKAAGARRIILAGKPGAGEDDLKAAGLTDAVYTGMDMVTFLSSVLADAGVSS